MDCMLVGSDFSEAEVRQGGRVELGQRGGVGCIYYRSAVEAGCYVR